MWAAGRPRQAPPAPSTAPPLTQSNQTRWTHLQTLATSGEASEVNFKTRAHYLILTSTLYMKIFNFFSRFRILQQTHHSHWADPFHASHGLPIAASCIPPAYCWLSLVAARSWQWWRMGTPRTRHSSPAETQPQPHPHVSQFPPESTQLQCQLLCNGRGLTQHREQSTGWHG